MIKEICTDKIKTMLSIFSVARIQSQSVSATFSALIKPPSLPPSTSTTPLSSHGSPTTLLSRNRFFLPLVRNLTTPFSTTGTPLGFLYWVWIVTSFLKRRGWCWNWCLKFCLFSKTELRRAPLISLMRMTNSLQESQLDLWFSLLISLDSLSMEILVWRCIIAYTYQPMYNRRWLFLVKMVHTN